MARFKRKRAIVTGGAGGIGSAICQRLAAEGALVRVLDTNADAANSLAAKIGGTAHVIDLYDAQAIECFVAEIGDSGIDVLCNNAGLIRRGALSDISPEDWHLSFAVNLNALFLMCKAVIPVMTKRGGGAIVNTASQWGLHPAPGHIAYNTSKAAVVAFTKSLARDYASEKIRVNAIAPGEVRTPMLETNLSRTDRSIDDLNRLVPFDRTDEPEEIAALVAFLASDEARYLCGSVVEITGARAVA